MPAEPMQEEACDEGMGMDGFGNPMSPDFGVQNPMAAFPQDEEYEDDFSAQEPAPETVHAALSRPAYRVSAANTAYSVTAASILNGDVDLNRIFGL